MYATSAVGNMIPKQVTPKVVLLQAQPGKMFPTIFYVLSALWARISSPKGDTGQYVICMNWSGIILGASAFLLIGLFHPIVIKAEYYLGIRCWWMFAIGGLVFCAASLVVGDITVAAILGVAGFSCFWSILELFEQRKRVEKGWFPENPGKKK